MEDPRQLMVAEQTPFQMGWIDVDRGKFTLAQLIAQGGIFGPLFRTIYGPAFVIGGLRFHSF